MNNVFSDVHANITQHLKWNTEYLELIDIVAPLFDTVDLSDCASVSVYKYNQTIEVDFRISPEQKNTKLPHALAQHFGMNFTKSPDYTGECFKYAGNADIDLPTYKILRIELTGILPETCHIVESEEEIPEDQIRRTRTVRKIECKGTTKKEN